MGSNESGPLLADSETELDLQQENLEFLPYRIPQDHPLKALLLSHNRVSLTPTTLTNLETLDVSYNELWKHDFSEMAFCFPHLRSLSVSGNSLEMLPRCIQEFSELVDIYADHNKLIDGQIGFDKLTALENADLFLNMLKEIPAFPPSIASINIGFNYIKEVSFSLPNLRELRLPGNDINMISKTCSFPQLQVLDLSMNNIDELPPISEIAPRLESLLVAFNFLVKFPNNIPTTIEKIDCSHNVLTTWDDGLDENVNLKTLDVSYNRLRNVPHLPPLLQSFNAENNELTEVTSFNMNNIETVQFNQNMFTTIPDLKECGATSLTFSHNKLTEIDITKIGGNIMRLDFTSNFIKEIPLDTFLLERIQTLNFTANQITSLPNGIASSYITSLYISENDISSLPELPSTLMTLEAIKCSFTEFPQQTFSLTRISNIDFSNNQITKVEKFPCARHISLSCNRIQVIPEIPDTLTFLDLSHNLIREINIQGEFVMLQELDISHNQIDNIISDNLPVMHTLKMSHNPLKNYSLDFSKLPAIRICDVTMTNVKLPTKIPDKIKEFATSNVEFFKQNPKLAVRLFQPTKCGYSETCGIRPSMEDALIIRENVIPNLNIYAVIDGHGGTDTASLAAYFIPHYFAEEKSKSIASFSSVIKRLIDRLKRQSVRDGATIAFTIVTPTEVSCAYLGDTRALIVSKSGKVSPMSFDHKPTEPTEIALIRENRSFVSEKRTAGILAISRAIGDFHINGVSHVPDMTTHMIKETDYRLVIACDGVFDVLSQEEIGEIVAKEPDVNLAATIVRNIALSRHSQDNISVIVVDL